MFLCEDEHDSECPLLNFTESQQFLPISYEGFTHIDQVNFRFETKCKLSLGIPEEGVHIEVDLASTRHISAQFPGW